MVAVLCVLVVAVPLGCWAVLARTAVVGAVVGLLLAGGAGVLLAAGAGLLDLRGLFELFLWYPLAAALLVGAGLRVERRLRGVQPDAPRAPRTVLRVHAVVVTAVAPLCALVAFTAADVPPAAAVPSLPPGFTLGEQTAGCGSGDCWREMSVAGPEGMPSEEVVRRLGLPDDHCHANGWLLDRRPLCTRAEVNGGSIRLYVSLGDLIG
ncbi:hypothetical protein KNE206_03530 [Kitasatospora sp. NE20-6]|uniref:hypothetical protein n=1 Tax=Kitasatospora sp. NE20-6 TaxID=2859066 RepID=UPI0034DBF6FA